MKYPGLRCIALHIRRLPSGICGIQQAKSAIGPIALFVGWCVVNCAVGEFEG